MIYRDSIYFSIGTRIDLKDNTEIGVKVLNTIFDFCKDPLKKKSGNFFPSREYMEEKMKKGLYLFDEKDG